MAARHILLVEPDELLAHSLAEQLQGEGFDCAPAPTAATGRAQAAAQPFDMAVIAASLPDGNGLALCREFRDAGLEFPILLLTAEAAEARAAGASDHLAKPFRLGALLTRLRALARQHEQSAAAALTLGPYAFHPAARLLVAGERKVKLTDKEAAILKCLYRAGGTVSRESLLDEVWGYQAGLSTHTLETHIYRLRQKMTDDPGLLATEPGGYRLRL